jgi:S1-C subfamily serine protease
MAGVTVSQVTPGGAADKAGIVAGDVITAVNSQALTSLADLQNIVAGLIPGTPATVTAVCRDGTQKTVHVVPDNCPASPTPLSRSAVIASGAVKTC